MLIVDPNNQELSKKLSKALSIDIFYPEIHVFPDGERRIRINQNVANKSAAILKSISTPVETNLLEFCFTVDALRRNGINNIFGIITYLGYSRADHIFRVGEAVPLEVVIKILEASGVDKVLLIDPHSIKTPELFHVDVQVESALSLFGRKIKEIESDKNNISVVSPDMGGIRRIKILSRMLGGVKEATINKDRDLQTGELKNLGVEGNLNSKCFIVDDMISTGGTMTEAIDAVTEKGVEEVYVFVTHPVLSGDAPKVLQNSKAKKVFMTDTINIPENKRFPKLEILSVAPIIASKIQEWIKNFSV
ncbi:MAG: hypothetical protein A2857_01510 [Candidatus Levybacteria bacterium RIFCSPHIGHO2_01_FULL_36_15]|nr:MAG: hypothetical protein A2857_01510 [Candidatus Levybacteria bacterium RIFCSPHIGHO2_01_FULL_36_15]